MAINIEKKRKIINLLIKKMSDKLKRYTRESSSMPFLVRLIQDQEKVASFSFIQSVATTLGMSIYEEVSKILVEDTAQEVFTGYDIGGNLSRGQKSKIEDIIRELRNGTRKVNKRKEVKEVLEASSNDAKPQKEGSKVDFYMKRDNMEYYIEIKTVKPNIDVFTKSKAKLLEWVARKRMPVETILALPYNPYHPEPYQRFTVQGVLELGKELLVGNEYWDFLSGKGTYRDLLDIFDEVGKQFKNKINKKIKEVARIKYKI